MRKPDTTGEYAIPNVETRGASRADELPMDSDAFAGFYQRSAPGLRAYLTRVSGNHALADDLVQESYLRFLCATCPEGGEVNYRRYLYRIATNLLRDHWRQGKNAPVPLVEAASASRPVGSVAKQNSEGTSNEGTEDKIHAQSDMGRVLQKMKPRERELLWLAYVEGSSHREIAEIVGLKEQSIRTMLFRARNKMAGLLRGRGLVSKAQ